MTLVVRRLLSLSGSLPVFVVLAVLMSCSNNPYSEKDDDVNVLYTVYSEAPKTLDPAVSYNVTSHSIIGPINETLVEYHYLKRPYELMPGLAKEIPEPNVLGDGRVSYTFALREGVIFQNDPAFELGGAGKRTRKVVADDYVFEFMRVADPGVNSPVIHIFSKIEGFHDFGVRLLELRKDPAFKAMPVREQYQKAGPIEGLRAPDDYTFEVVLTAPYPQLIFWFAMPFTTAVPWEAVQYYDGNDGRPRFADHPVGLGPYRMTHYDKQFRIVLERNENWYGALHPEWKAPGAVYPGEGEEGDREKGYQSDELAGRQLPFIDRIEFRREKEAVPKFNKFLQGYYDKSGITKESFDKVIQGNDLSPEMASMGVSLDRVVQLSVSYIGFNMVDGLVGTSAGDRGRKLRQAMSLAVDADEYIELFLNGRGVPAQSVLPPGIFGNDPEYKNEFRAVDLERARRLLVEGGYPNGIDPATDQPLKLRFDTAATSATQLITIRYLVDSWRKLGLDVEVKSTTYNKFQEKVDNRVHQIFQWGWVADYPDPENFLFLLTAAMADKHGPNSANFRNAEFDALFAEMKSRPDGDMRRSIIEEMLGILEQERPWIELVNPVSYVLFHEWVNHYKPPGFEISTLKYQGIDSTRRGELRREWNVPVMWPVYLLLVIAIAIIAPGVLSLIRERQ